MNFIWLITARLYISIGSIRCAMFVVSAMAFVPPGCVYVFVYVCGMRQTMLLYHYQHPAGPMPAYHVALLPDTLYQSSRNTNPHLQVFCLWEIITVQQCFFFLHISMYFVRLC